MVRPDNFGHDVNFCDVRLVDVLAQNPVQEDDSFIRTSVIIIIRSFASMNWAKWSELTVGMPQLFFTRRPSLCSGALKSQHNLQVT